MLVTGAGSMASPGPSDATYAAMATMSSSEARNNGAHQRRLYAIAGRLLKVIELSRDVAGRAIAKRWHVVLAHQILAVAAAARRGLSLDRLLPITIEPPVVTSSLPRAMLPIGA